MVNKYYVGYTSYRSMYYTLLDFSSTMNGILTTLLVMSPLNVGQMIQDVRNWESERNRTPVEEMLNNSLQELEWGDYGSDGSTVVLS
jgi:hypothetical protein